MCQTPYSMRHIPNRGATEFAHSASRTKERTLLQWYSGKPVSRESSPEYLGQFDPQLLNDGRTSLLVARNSFGAVLAGPPNCPIYLDNDYLH